MGKPGHGRTELDGMLAQDNLGDQRGLKEEGTPEQMELTARRLHLDPGCGDASVCHFQTGGRNQSGKKR